MAEITCTSYQMPTPDGGTRGVWGIDQFDAALITTAVLCLTTPGHTHEYTNHTVTGLLAMQNEPVAPEFLGHVADLVTPNPEDWENLLKLCIFNEDFLKTAPEEKNNKTPLVNIYENIYTYVKARIEARWLGILTRAVKILKASAQ